MTLRTLFLLVLLVGAVRAQSVPAPAERPVESLAAAQELKDLLALLDDVPPQFGSNRTPCYGNSLSDVSLRLALFPRRFDVDPRSLTAWAPLQGRARQLLLDIQSGEILEPLLGSLDDWPNADEVKELFAQMPMDEWIDEVDRYALSDIAGTLVDPEQALAAVRIPFNRNRTASIAQTHSTVSARRSEMLERRGDLTSALAAQQEACLDAVVLDSPCGSDLLFARYGLLLIDNGYRNEGMAVLAGLVREQPDSLGATIAWETLADIDIAHRPADAVLHRVYIGAGKPLYALAVSFTVEGVPQRIRILATQLGNRGSKSGASVTVLDRGSFESLRPYLVTKLRTGSFRASADALLLLHALQGGAEPLVPECLDRLGSYPSRATGVNAQEFDDTFRVIYGDGPNQSDARRMQPRWIADAWREWLASR